MKTKQFTVGKHTVEVCFSNRTKAFALGVDVDFYDGIAVMVYVAFWYVVVEVWRE